MTDEGIMFFKRAVVVIIIVVVHNGNSKKISRSFPTPLSSWKNQIVLIYSVFRKI